MCYANDSTSTLFCIFVGNSIKFITPCGLLPYTVWNGITHVDCFTELLYANSSYANTFSQWLGRSKIKHLNKSPRILFKTFVCPWFCKWYAELNCNLVSSFFHKVLQKRPMNLLSLSEIILFSSPFSLTTSLKNNTTIIMESLVFWHRMKSSIFKNMPNATNMESLSHASSTIPTENPY